MLVKGATSSFTHIIQDCFTEEEVIEVYCICNLGPLLLTERG